MEVTRDPPKPWQLSPEQRAALHDLYSRHGRVAEDLTSELNFQEFCSLTQSLHLSLNEEEQRKAFELARQGRPGHPETVSFEEVSAWIAGSEEAQAALELLTRQQDAAALSAGLARFTVALLRPLSGMALVPMLLAMKLKAAGAAKLCLLGFKKGMVFAKAKAALSLEAYMKSPIKLFRRQVISPLDPFRQSDLSTVEALRKEVREGGLKGLSTKSFTPYLANAFIAMVMFHTYTTTRLRLHGLAATYPSLDEMPLCCEAAAGACAGVMQATLHSPLYNVRLCRDDEIAMNRDQKGLFQRLGDLRARTGVRGYFQNYSFIMAQETLALMTFFTSYEWLKLKTTSWARHMDHSGEKDLWGWAMAACGSGVLLSAVGTPFENLLAWHVANRQPKQPKGVWKHFLQAPRDQRSKILFGGLRSKLLVAPLAGIPLLAYEVMVHQGTLPRFHP